MCCLIDWHQMAASCGWLARSEYLGKRESCVAGWMSNEVDEIDLSVANLSEMDPRQALFSSSWLRKSAGSGARIGVSETQSAERSRTALLPKRPARRY